MLVTLSYGTSQDRKRRLATVSFCAATSEHSAEIASVERIFVKKTLR